MECLTNQNNKLKICMHPIISSNLAIIRNKNTNSANFRNAVKKISQILFYKATENLPTSSVSVETPLMTAQANVIKENTEIIIAPILRAGLMFCDAALEIIPQAQVHHIGLYRDEDTLKPVPYYNNLPQSFKSPESTYIYILDPMLATGGSGVAAVKLFAEMNIPQENITFISLISAPEGIERLLSVFKDLNIVTAGVDSGLNNLGYILPGLGDAGDRAFNTI